MRHKGHDHWPQSFSQSVFAESLCRLSTNERLYTMLSVEVLFLIYILSKACKRCQEHDFRRKSLACFCTMVFFYLFERVLFYRVLSQIKHIFPHANNVYHVLKLDSIQMDVTTAKSYLAIYIFCFQIRLRSIGMYAYCTIFNHALESRF